MTTDEQSTALITAKAMETLLEIDRLTEIQVKALENRIDELSNRIDTLESIIGTKQLVEDCAVFETLPAQQQQ